ncbi:MAG TPA: glycosyltransferase [Planctomycetaceae bacterium]|jgi:glycosyltransferase involved in cell wall biosynthesis
MISYAFPPDNASGAVRVGKFVSHLAEHHDWAIDVITPQVKSMSSQCEENQLLFPRSVSIRATRNFEIFDLVSRLRSRKAKPEKADRSASAADAQSPDRVGKGRKRSLLAVLSDLVAVPDTRTGWIYWAVREAIRAIGRSAEPTIILSSGPPHSAHVAAAIVKTIVRRPWIADLRDPWSSNPYSAVQEGPALRWNRVLERIVLKRADGILCNTAAATAVIRQRFSQFDRERILMVPNGYDPEDFDTLVPRSVWPAQSGPVLMHAGSIYGQRTPYALLEALGALYSENPATCPKLIFLGEWDPDIRSTADRLIERLNLSQTVMMRPSLPRQEALAAQAAADGLVLLGDALANGLQIPGKLFEYLRLQKPLLSLFSPGSPVENYLTRYAPIHALAAPDDAAAISQALRQLCSRIDENCPKCECISELSRRHQVEQVHGLLNDVLQSSRT